LRARTQRSRIFAPPVQDRIETTGIIDELHEAVIAQRVLRLSYRDKSASASERDVEPLCLAFWGGAWTLGAWCRMRCDFRNFRPDRIAGFAATGEAFAETPERGLAAYLRAMGAGMDAIES
jgi:predicted DNA-binding transcriptional regulator YafY